MYCGGNNSTQVPVRLPNICCLCPYLETALQHSEWELVCGLRGQPQPEVRVGLDNLLQDLLQGFEPLGKQVAVLHRTTSGQIVITQTEN